MLARPPHEEDRYVDWRNTLADIPDGEHIDDDGIGYFDFPDLHVQSDISEATKESNQNADQNVHQRMSKRATWKAHKPDKAKQGGSNLELNAILIFSPILLINSLTIN